MTTALDHFAVARKANADAARILSPEQRREQARSNIADVQRRMSRYCRVRGDGTVQIDRTMLRQALAELASTAAALPARVTTGDMGEVSQAVEQVAMAFAEINRELKGAR
jgi:hypothetical protein